MKQAQSNQMKNFKGKRKVSFKTGEICMTKWYETNKSYFVKCKIAEKLGKLHYVVSINIEQFKRHVDQLRPCMVDTTFENLILNRTRITNKRVKGILRRYDKDVVSARVLKLTDCSNNESTR